MKLLRIVTIITHFMVGALQGIGASLVIIKNKIFPINVILGKLNK